VVVIKVRGDVVTDVELLNGRLHEEASERVVVALHVKSYLNVDMDIGIDDALDMSLGAVESSRASWPAKGLRC
jgi:hypothetical protein